MSEVRPEISERTEDFLDAKETIFSLFEDSKEPKHVIFPQKLAENAEEIKKTFEQIGLEHSIYFAHKPTKSSVLVKKAEETGINIDVASEPELESALNAGFTGDRIECTGPKNRDFLERAVEENCMISLDSFNELNILTEVLEEKDTEAQVLVRIADPSNPDRDLSLPVSKFGVNRDRAEQAIQKIAETSNIELKGFHFHNDVREADSNAGFVADCLELIKKSYSQGLKPDTINIGGGLRKNQLEDLGDWTDFIARLEEDIIDDRQTETWRDNGYGMHLNLKGRVSGRDKLQGRFTDNSYRQVLENMFNYRYNGRNLADQLRENMFQVITEPGKLLLDQCGVTFVRVVGTKELPSGEKMVQVDANKYNLSGNMSEQLMDPIHIQENNESNSESCEAFIGGNLCLEEDLLIHRKIEFDSEPENGDVLCFVNTVSNYVDFEDAAPHMHPRGQKMVAVKQNSWKVKTETEYLEEKY